MNSWSRFAGYLGLVLLVSSVVLLVASSIRRETVLTGVAAGYVLVIGRLGYVATTAQTGRTRTVARLGMLLMFMVAVGLGGFVGISLLQATSA